MKKQIISLVAAAVLMTGCANGTKPTETPPSNTSEQTTTPTTTTTKQTTTTIQTTTTFKITAATTATVQNVTTEPIEETESIFDYYKSKGKIIYEGKADENSDLYILMVEEIGETPEDLTMTIYFRLPSVSIERDVYTIVTSVQPYLDICDHYNTVGLHWYDNKESTIAFFVASKLSNEWFSPAGITWLNKEYEATLNELLAQTE